MAIKITPGVKVAPAKKPGIPSLSDWLNSDGTYLDTVNSVNTALKNNLAENNSESGNYDTTFLNDLRNLGYQGGAFKGTGPTSIFQGGTWNTNDPLTQSGRAFAQQAQDFAARGMQQSSGFGTAMTNLGRQLGQQLSNANLSRQNYQQGLSSMGASQQQQASDALLQAKREAIARRANKYATSATGVLQ